MNRHALASATLSALALAAVGCSLHKSSGTAALSPTSYRYSATASVGDFVSITVDEVAHTITYDNQSTGESGVADYHVASDGSYAIDTDHGPMAATRAYEVPGYAFIMAAGHTGQSHTPSIVTAIHTQPITVADMSGGYNYMQFRTNSGGVEIGDVQFGNGTITPSHYSPGSSSFGGNTMSMSGITEHGDYLTSNDDFIFRTTDGFFAVDTTNGGLVCLHKAASAAFQPAVAGTYHAMIFGKTGASTGGGNVESPAVGDLSQYRVAVTNSGSVGAPVAHIVVTDVTSPGPGTVVVDHDLAPIDDTMVGAGMIANPCPGAFTTAIGASQYFVIFMNDSLLIAAYTDHPGGGLVQPSYDYWYGVALRDLSSGG